MSLNKKRKSQNIVEISLLAGLIVIITISVFSIYNSKKIDLVNMSKVVETGGGVAKPGGGGGGPGGGGNGGGN
ncbi:MAG: hypothetical protein WCY19_04395 [Candidatus Gastranaerophilaceae bacterium]